MPTISDEIEYGLFVLPSAFVALSVSSSAPTWRMQFVGNRQGLASLASVCLWLGANAYRREFLSLTALPFIKTVSDVAVMVRVSAAEESGRFGLVRSLDSASQVEWELSEEELQRLALRLHYLASVPEHEYELLEVGPAAKIESDYPTRELMFRESRAEQWLPADGAIACFSSSSFSFSLNDDRAPQLKPSVRRFQLEFNATKFHTE